MSAFNEVYTSQQREAVAFAYEEMRVRPAQRVADLAAAGRLTLDGLTLEAFEMPVSTVRHQVRNYRKRAAAGSDLATLPHRDAIERLRVDLVTAADRMLADYLRQVRRDAGKANPERGRQIARMVREAAALPGLNDPRPSAPGVMRDGVRNGGETRGGLAAQIFEAHFGSPAPEPVVERDSEPAVSDVEEPAAVEVPSIVPLPRSAASGVRDDFDYSRLAVEDTASIDVVERGGRPLGTSGGGSR